MHPVLTSLGDSPLSRTCRGARAGDGAPKPVTKLLVSRAPIWRGLLRKASRYCDQFLSPKHLDCMAAIAEHSMPVRA